MCITWESESHDYVGEGYMRLGTIPGFSAVRFAYSRRTSLLQCTLANSRGPACNDSGALQQPLACCQCTLTQGVYHVKSRRCSSHSPKDLHVTLALPLTSTQNARPEILG